MTTSVRINHKRSSSNMNLQSFEPPVQKASFTSLPPSEHFEVPKVSSFNVKKVFTRAPMGDFLTKCGLISRGQQVFEDIFINEDKIYVPPMPKSCNASINTRAHCSTASLDFSFSCYFDGMDKFSYLKPELKAKCNSSFYSNETEQNNSGQKQEQQLLLETRAREESSEFSIIGDEEDQIQDEHKCDFLTERIDPSAQIIIQACEFAQPIEQSINAGKVEINIDNLDDCDSNENNDNNDGYFEFKVLEIGTCN